MATRAAAVKGAPKSKTLEKKTISANNYVALVAVVSALVLAVTIFIGNSLVHTLVLNTKVAAGKTKAKGDLEKKLDNAPQLVDRYNSLGFRKQLIEHSLPTSPDFPQLVSIMENMSSASGVTLKSTDPSIEASTPGDVTGSTPVEYQFGAQVEGPYARIVEFIKNTEKSARPMKVISVTFKGSSSDLTADLKVITYYQGKADISDKKEPVK